MNNNEFSNNKDKNIKNVIDSLSHTKEAIGDQFPDRKAKNINDEHLPQIKDSVSEIYSEQNLLMREQYSRNIISTMKFQRVARIGLTVFFAIYLIIITIFVFAIVYNPNNYSDNLKITLLTTFFLNIFGVVYFIVRYVFQPLDDFMEEFRSMDGNKNKKDKNNDK